MLEIQVWSLGCENPLEKGMAIHSSIFAQRIPQSGMLQSTGVRHYWDTSSTFQLENFAIEAVFPGTIISSASYELEWYNIFRDRNSKKRHRYPYYVVQLFRHIWLFASAWTAARLASLSFPISRSLLKLMSIESVKPSNPLILCRPFLLLPSIFPRIMVFSASFMETFLLF